jgi:hypothetical protein
VIGKAQTVDRNGIATAVQGAPSLLGPAAVLMSMTEWQIAFPDSGGRTEEDSTKDS